MCGIIPGFEKNINKTEKNTKYTRFYILGFFTYLARQIFKMGLVP